MSVDLSPARAAVWHDLVVRGLDDAASLSDLDAAVRERTWWVEQWPDGEAYAPGLIAQDVQDRVLDRQVRWPLCHSCAQPAEHTLGVEPELGDDPHWTCTESGLVVAPVGGLEPPP